MTDTLSAPADQQVPLAQILHRKGDWDAPALTCSLDYAGRFIRRKRLLADDGTAFVIDLAHTTSLEDGDALELEDGRLVRITAAAEALLRVTGDDLVRIAWHIGNRHTPCQMGDGCVMIQDDPVIAHMLGHVGAQVEKITSPFTPEGGAYGMGRTHSHEHGHTAHAH